MHVKSVRGATCMHNGTLKIWYRYLVGRYESRLGGHALRALNRITKPRPIVMRNLSNKTLIRFNPIDLVREVDGLHGRSSIHSHTQFLSLSHTAQ